MIKFLLNRPIGVIMMTLALAVLGLVAMSRLPISLMPDVDIPEITITYSLDGASVREVENSVTTQLRNQLRQTQHLADLSSESYEGGGKIIMRFNFGTDINYIFVEVNEHIDDAMKYLPKDMSRPSIIKASTSDIPVFYIYLTLKGEQTEKRFLEFSEFTETVLKKRLEQLNDVAIVDMSGYYEPEIYILPDYSRMLGLGITNDQLKEAIDENNSVAGSLAIKDGYMQYNVKFTSQLMSSEDVENIYLNIEGRLIQIKDIAEVDVRARDKRSIFYNGDKQGLCLSVIKQSDARMSEMKESVSDMLKHFRIDYPDIDFTVARDQAELLNYSISNLELSLILGIILAIGIMFFFLKDPRSPLIIALSIPVSVVITMLFFQLFHISINTISLAGLIMGVGMMVDNAIIVIDNISQFRQRGYTLFEACATGTSEIITPLLSSVLTTCAVFIPLIFMGGISGALFTDEAAAVTIGLFVSLAVSITFIPVLFRLMLQRKENSSVKGLEIQGLNELYTKGYHLIFDHKRTSLIIVSLIVVAGLITGIFLKKEQMPPVETSDLIVKIDWNSSLHIDENDVRVRDIIERFGDRCDEISAHVGEKLFFLNNGEKQHTNESELYVKCSTLKSLRSLIGEMTNYIRTNYPESIVKTERVENLFEQIFKSDPAPIILYVGDENERVPNIEVVNKFIDTLQYLYPELDLDHPATEERLVIHIMPEMLALYNVKFDLLISTLEKEISKTSIGQLNTGNRYVPLVITEDEKTIRDILVGTSIKNDPSSGNKDDIALTSLVTLGYEKDYKTINGRKEGGVVTIPIYDNNISPGELMHTSSKIADESGLSLYFGGSFVSGSKTMYEMGIIIIVAILILYFIMAAQFESLKLPLIILTEIPIDICFILVVMGLTGISMNLMSMIGVVVVCGVVINDSIIKIDTIIRLEKSGMPLLEAIHEGGIRRLKPILMTSFTTIFAMIPMLWGNDIGTQLQFPLAVTIIAGMFFGTLVSLFLVPLFYYLTRSKRKGDSTAES